MIILSPHAGIEISQSVCTEASVDRDSGNQCSAELGLQGTELGASLPFPRQLRGLGRQRWTGLLISHDISTEKVRGRRWRKLQVASRPVSCLPGTEIRGDASRRLGGPSVAGADKAERAGCIATVVGTFHPRGCSYQCFRTCPVNLP